MQRKGLLGNPPGDPDSTLMKGEGVAQQACQPCAVFWEQINFNFLVLSDYR